VSLLGDPPDDRSESDVVRAFADLYRRDEIDAVPLDRAEIFAPGGPHARPTNGHRRIIDVTGVDFRRTGADTVLRPGDPRAPAPSPPPPPRAPVPDDAAWCAPTGTAAPPALRRRAGARLAERHLADLLAVMVASGAFIAPWHWLVAVAATCLLVGAVGSVRTGDESTAAAVVALPGSAVRRVVRLAHPRSLVWLPVITARTVLAAIVLPAAVGGALWLSDHGLDGVFAAARVGAWHSGFRVAAALVCLMIVGGIGDGRARRAELVRRAAAGVSDAGIAALASAALLVTVVTVVEAPRLSGGTLAGADGLGWLPPRLRPTADRVRDTVVTSELHAVGACLTAPQGVVWATHYSEDNPVAAPDVALLSAAGGPAPEDGQLVTAALAADNQLAPWVEVLEIADGDAVVFTIDRSALPHHELRTDASTLASVATTGRDRLAAAASRSDLDVALACSAGPVL
jgi:hypothetical protein